MRQFNFPALAAIAAIAATHNVRMEDDPAAAAGPGSEPIESPTKPETVRTAVPLASQPVESAVEKASREARDRIKSGVSLDPSVDPPGKRPAAPAKPREPSTGKFKPGGDPSGSVGDSTHTARRAAAAEPEGEGEPEGGQAQDEADPDAGKGTEPGKKKEPVAGAPAEGEEGGEEGEQTAEELEAAEAEKLTVQLPNRRDGGEPLSVVMPDEETANALRMVVNGFERKESVDARATQVNRMAQDYEELKEIMSFDPGGFAVDQFSDDPATAEQVALSLLALPGVWERVQERVLAWEDPVRAENDRVKIENSNLKRKEELRDSITEQRAVQSNLREVQTAVASVIPPDMDEDQQAVFFRDALRDLKEYADRNRRMTLDVADIPLILASSGRLKAHGIDPKDAAVRIVEARTNRRPASSNGTQRPATSATVPAKKPSGSPPPQKTGKEMVQGRQAKRAAASSPTGAGPPSSVVTPPPNQTTEERIKWHRDRVKKSATLTR